jgi:hypothetical protein
MWVVGTQLPHSKHRYLIELTCSTRGENAEPANLVARTAHHASSPPSGHAVLVVVQRTGTTVRTVWCSRPGRVPLYAVDRVFCSRKTVTFALPSTSLACLERSVSYLPVGNLGCCNSNGSRFYKETDGAGHGVEVYSDRSRKSGSRKNRVVVVGCGRRLRRSPDSCDLHRLVADRHNTGIDVAK